MGNYTMNKFINTKIHRTLLVLTKIRVVVISTETIVEIMYIIYIHVHYYLTLSVFNTLYI